MYTGTKMTWTELLLCWTLFFIAATSSAARKVDPKRTLVWGSGLKAEVVLPIRYFYIHAVDTKGENFTDSVGKDAFAVSVVDGSGGRIRVRIELLDRHDGSYIARYRLYGSGKDLKIEVKYKSKHVGSSPYSLTGPVYHEKCNCPEHRVRKWLKDMDCPSSIPQLKKELSLFSKMDFRPVAEELISRFGRSPGSYAIAQYVVKDNQVYRRTFGEHVGFKMFMDKILLSLTRKVRLPDVEFFINLGDWPLEKREENPLPLFSWCGSEDTKDIILPTYDLTDSTLETMAGKWYDIMRMQNSTAVKWEDKTDLAFFRGRDSRRERLQLIQMSDDYPDIIDAKLTNMFFFKKELKDVEKAPPVHMQDYFKHKYQVNIDGTVAAYRLPYLLAANSLVLKQDSEYYEHFYKDLKPYVHYVPFKRDLSDLLKQIQWAKDHDEEVQQIVKNAQTYVRENLMPDDILCYHVIAFQEFAKKLTSKVEVLDDMELVEQPSTPDAHCDCKKPQKKKQKDKDEL